jgi:hypothetical protein
MLDLRRKATVATLFVLSAGSVGHVGFAEKPSVFGPGPGPIPSELPLPTAADRDADVAKRPRFRRSLTDARTFFYFGTDGVRLPQQVLTRQEVSALLADMKKSLKKEFVPDAINDDVEWFATAIPPYDSPFAPDANHRLRTIGATWQTQYGEAEVAQGFGFTESLVFRLRTEGRKLVNVKAPERNPDAHLKRYAGVEINEVRQLLTQIVSCPFAAPEDFELYGGVRVFEGVHAFVGLAKQARPGDMSPEDWDADPWCRDISLLITDSDPQYVSLTLDLREEQ